MKFVQVLKSVAAAAAFVAAGHAVAAEYTVANGLLSASSTGKLTLSNDSDPDGSSVVGAFSLINSSLQAAVSGSAPATAFFGLDANQFDTAGADAPITRVVTDASGKVTDVYSQGGLKLSAIVTTASKGGSIVIGNLHGDLVNGILYADVVGTPTYSGGVAFTQTNVPFFTWTALTGATSATGPGTYLTSLSGLAATATAKTLMTNAMGLRGIGLSTLNALTNYGTLDTTITVVPEPSTYALMGLGLAAGVFVARRRSARA